MAADEWEETVEHDDDGPTDLPHVWAISLADLCMLLMSFFIFLFALSSTQPSGVSDTLESVRKRLQVGSGTGPGKLNSPSRNEGQDSLLEQSRQREAMIRKQRQAFDELRVFMEGKGDKNFKASLAGPRMTLSMPTDGMYTSGEVQLTEAGRQSLLTLKEFLIRHGNERVNIRGFTDDAPPAKDSRFRDNWELSSIRAVSALRFLVAQGVPANRLTATGLADLEPVFPNTGEDNRARNRRLDFVLEVWEEG